MTTDIPGFRRFAAERPGRPAAISGHGAVMTYTLAAWTNRLSNAFAGAGLRPGDAVAALLRNGARPVWSSARCRAPSPASSATPASARCT